MVPCLERFGREGVSHKATFGNSDNRGVAMTTRTLTTEGGERYRLWADTFCNSHRNKNEAAREHRVLSCRNSHRSQNGAKHRRMALSSGSSRPGTTFRCSLERDTTADSAEDLPPTRGATTGRDRQSPEHRMFRLDGSQIGNSHSSLYPCRPRVEACSTLSDRRRHSMTSAADGEQESGNSYGSLFVRRDWR